MTLDDSSTGPGKVGSSGTPNGVRTAAGERLWKGCVGTPGGPGAGVGPAHRQRPGPRQPQQRAGGSSEGEFIQVCQGPGLREGPPSGLQVFTPEQFPGLPCLGGGRMEKTRFFLKEVKLEVTGVKTSSCTPRERSKEAGACARGLRGGGEAWSAWDQVGRSGLWGGVQGRGLPGHGARGSELGRCGSRLLRTPRGCGQHIRHPGICPHCHAAPLPTSHPVPSPVAPPWGDPLEVHPPPSTTTCVQTQPVPGRLRRPRPGPSASRPSPSSPVSV